MTRCSRVPTCSSAQVVMPLQSYPQTAWVTGTAQAPPPGSRPRPPPPEPVPRFQDLRLAGQRPYAGARHLPQAALQSPGMPVLQPAMPGPGQPRGERACPSRLHVLASACLSPPGCCACRNACCCVPCRHACERLGISARPSYARWYGQACRLTAASHCFLSASCLSCHPAAHACLTSAHGLLWP